MVSNGDCDGHEVYSGGGLVAMPDGLVLVPLIMFGGWMGTVMLSLST